MAPTFFLDTNVLVYSFDDSDTKKQKLAEDLIEQAIESGKGFISSQVVQEFCNVAVTKYDKKITAQDLESFLKVPLSRLWRHTPTIDFYKRALSLYASCSISFYDALIIQAALDLGCDVLYSEDLQDGQKFGALTVKNPFN